MRILVMAVIILVNFVLQATLFPHFAIVGVTPDTAMVIIISYGILRGDIEGAIFGFCAGLMQDLFGGTFIGMYALLGFLTGYVCGKPFRDFFKNNYFLPFAVVVVVGLIHQLVVYFATMAPVGAPFWHYFGTIILPKTVYTASLAIPIYSLLHVINARIERHEENFRSLFGSDAE